MNFINLLQDNNRSLDNHGYNTAYFVTLSCKDNFPYFGKVKKNKKQLSPIGVIATIIWKEIEKNNPELIVANFAVMPDHISSILIMNERKPRLSKRRMALEKSKTKLELALLNYQESVMAYTNKMGYEFEWQQSFYENSIRSSVDFFRVYEHINKLDSIISYN